MKRIQPNKFNIPAFTLAEVLITLGIIGVVAAMTIPTLINSTKNKELEAAFKKSYSSLVNASLQVNSDEQRQLDLSSSQDRLIFMSYFKTVSKGTFTYTGNEGFESIRVFDKTSNIHTSDYGQWYNCSYDNCFFKLADGSVIIIDETGFSGYFGGAFFIQVDTNGMYRGPNRLGYDIFMYSLSTDNKIVPNSGPGGPESVAACEPMSLGGYSGGNDSGGWGGYNGSGCTLFAIRNVCPWAKNKGYWENLP